MFAACDDAAFREFFDKGSRQAGDVFGITRQASVRNDGSDFTEIEYRSEVDVESGSFEFRRDDARSDAQLRRAGIGDEKPLPASLSARVIDGFLRKKLGYKGVVITDDLTMGAITSFGLTPELFLRAFEVGNDVLLFSQSTPLVEDAFNTILKAVRRSAALRERLDESVERILALKSRDVAPLRYRTHLKARISRQVEKLRHSVVEIGARHVTV